MVDFDFDFRYEHATLSADPGLLEAIAGKTREDFCRTTTLDNSDILDLCWGKVESHRGVEQWIAMIPTPEEIASLSHDELSDPQPNFPWRHIDECPWELEANVLCQKLLEEAGSRVILPYNIVPYAGALAVNGDFYRSPNSQVIDTSRGTCCSNVCRLFNESAGEDRIAVGYSLEDGTRWFPHIWLMRQNGSLVETGTLQSAYYGVTLGVQGSRYFADHYAKGSKRNRRRPKWS